MEPKRVMTNFSAEEEESIREFLFTNPHGDTSLVYPQPLVAGEELAPLMSAVSRTHMPTQDRVLQFLDREKAEQTRAFFQYIQPLVEVFRLSNGTLRVSRRTGNFNREWVLAHGHGSIKEGTNLFGHAENISDITGKRITGHPLNHPQVKSTRYISYGKVLEMSLEDEDVLSLPNAEEAVEYVRWMNQRYLDTSARLRDLVYDHPDTREVVAFLRRSENVEIEVQKALARKRMLDEGYVASEKDREEERRRVLEGLQDENVRRDVGKFVLDYSRVYLVAATRTSDIFSVDARTLEEIITDMISSPRLEDKKRGQELWDEAKKIAPVLLGEKSHVKIDQWKVHNEKELRAYMGERFGHISLQNHGKDRVRMLTPRDIEMYTDRFNAALVVFPYVDAAVEDVMGALSEGDIREVLTKAHEHREDHNVLHPAISHGGLMFEPVMAYHAYRDIFRHRRGSRSVQLLTTRLGFEIPAIFDSFGLREEYLEDMERCKGVYEKAREFSPHVAEKLVPFGANCRSLHSWQPNQVGYIARLRGDIGKGNRTYVEMAREMVAAFRGVMPITGEFLRVGDQDYPPHLWTKGFSWYDAERRGKE